MTNTKKSTDPVLRLVLCGLMLAIDVVLTRFASINLWDRRIGFSFVAVAMAAYCYGPIAGALVHGGSDLIGAILFPSGAYFPGYTLTAAIIGLLYGLCFYRSHTWWRVAMGVVSSQLIGSVALNTLWICITNHVPYWTLLPGRLLQAAVMIPVQLIVLPPLLAVLRRGARPMIGNE